MALCRGEGSERWQCYCLASGALPGTCSISSHFTHSLYVTGGLPVVFLVPNPRTGWFAYVLRLCGLFKQSLLKIQQFLLPPQPPLIFTSRTYGDLSSQCWNTGMYGLAWGWGRSLPRYSSQFLSTTCKCGTACSAAATSLHHTMSPSLSSCCCLHVSAPPTQLDECGFSKLLVFRLPYSSTIWLHWVVFV